MPNWLSYAWGNCTRWVAENLPWIPNNLGNAKDWAANAQKDGLTVSATPQVGSAVVYGAGNGYDATYGHTAEVIGVDAGGKGFTVSEMNVKGLNVTDTRHSTMQDVLGFILAPGSAGKGAVPSNIGQSIGGNGNVDLNPLDIPKGIFDHIVAPVGNGIKGFFASATTGVERFVVANIIALVVGVVIVLVVFSGDQDKPAAPAPVVVPV